MMSAGKLVGIAAAVMVVGLVGGAVLAAPDQVMPMAQAAMLTVAERSGPMLSSGSGMVSASIVRVIDAIDVASPRTLAMIAVGALTVMFALAALITSRRAGRGNSVAAPGAVAFSSSTPLSPRRSSGRPNGRSTGQSNSRSARPTPSQIHALAAQGTSLADIARGTGLPVDAIALMIAVADPARQLPHSAA